MLDDECMIDTEPYDGVVDNGVSGGAVSSASAILARVTRRCAPLLPFDDDLDEAAAGFSVGRQTELAEEATCAAASARAACQAASLSKMTMSTSLWPVTARCAWSSLSLLSGGVVLLSG